ncbi:acyl-CoA thioester hydrolase [Marinobacter daqiaonensis]|uniref:Acyl-CoA thioester hydrolase n=1 Tax=Marinobacter daqiaonensis TaxID=650891 RepID=A0A1I6GH28_9GAMM|nr:thioesterase family protein [Marinobacter daqiaonensis]SFR41486.1 acyl-CoA thioester hydrolase [Marinobacter daqiaonensis]
MTNDANRNRASFPVFDEITTRWADNDLYGHVNNVTYYAWFDSSVNRYLIEEGGLDIHRGDNIAYVVSSSCDYFSPIAYPERVEAGLRVEKLGNSSVIYNIGIFRQGEDEACALGKFVHVFVDRETDRPVPVPQGIRTALEKLLVQ